MAFAASGGAPVDVVDPDGNHIEVVNHSLGE